jgi:hypothetical protein
MKRESVYGLNSLRGSFRIPDVNLSTLKKKQVVNDENVDIEKKFKLLIANNESELNKKGK